MLQTPPPRPNTSPSFQVFTSLQPRLVNSPSPFCPSAWRNLLWEYPGDLGYLCEGVLTYGAQIGCQHPPTFRHSANHKIEAPDLISDKLVQDLAIGRVQRYLGPAMVSPLGLVPKHDGGWRRIHDLSWPEGFSVNDSIPDEAVAIRYTSLENIFDLVCQHGPGCYIIKRDIKEAFRNVPLAPSVRPLLAFEWEGTTYIECCLPFGLSTAPFIFNLFSEGLHWLLEAYLPFGSVAHYLDDFITVVNASAGNLPSVIATFDNVYIPLTDMLGIPRNDSKDGAGTIVTVLGFELDTDQLQARLPQEKLDRAIATVSTLLQRNRVSQKALQQALGFLQHCSLVVRLGRARLQSTYAMLQSFSSRYALRRLSHDAREDLTWWKDTLPFFNGIHLFAPERPLIALYTDASDTGLGLFFFHTSSQDRAKDWRSAAPTLPLTQAAIIDATLACGSAHINVKEVSAILQAFLLFAPVWAHHKVFIFTDSSTAQYGLARNTLHGPSHRPLLKLLSIAAAFDITFEPHWISTTENQLADALSRSDLPTLANLCPQWENFSALNRLPGSPPSPPSSIRATPS